MDPLCQCDVCDTSTVGHSSRRFQCPRQELFECLIREITTPERITPTDGEVAIICKKLVLLWRHRFSNLSISVLQIQPGSFCIMQVSCCMKVRNHFPHTGERCSFLSPVLSALSKSCRRATCRIYCTLSLPVELCFGLVLEI